MTAPFIASFVGAFLRLTTMQFPTSPHHILSSQNSSNAIRNSACIPNSFYSRRLSTFTIAMMPPSVTVLLRFLLCTCRSPIWALLISIRSKLFFSLMPLAMTISISSYPFMLPQTLPPSEPTQFFITSNRKMLSTGLVLHSLAPT